MGKLALRRGGESQRCGRRPCKLLRPAGGLCLDEQGLCVQSIPHPMIVTVTSGQPPGLPEPGKVLDSGCFGEAERESHAVSKCLVLAQDMAGTLVRGEELESLLLPS